MSIETGQKFPKSRRLKKADGTIAYTWDQKLHNWEGPALIPEGNERTQAIEEYLASPQFKRLALEILGGVAGAATGGTFFAAQAALRPALRSNLGTLDAVLGIAQVICT